ncbi:hypothetical protein N7G274_010524 [Stereocaulon virgatum]|uniref:Metallo-beta-lactamase domain-containing protein n=1 Tax=Stereocaulon virgatum TaxID=373712 RepID=A0ABR3ZUD7_9LECA
MISRITLKSEALSKCRVHLRPRNPETPRPVIAEAHPSEDITHTTVPTTHHLSIVHAWKQKFLLRGTFNLFGCMILIFIAEVGHSLYSCGVACFRSPLSLHIYALAMTSPRSRALQVGFGLNVCILIYVMVLFQPFPLFNVWNPPNMSPEPQINACYEPKSGTWQYIVADPTTNDAAIIDPVLDFDAATSSISTSTADKLLDLIARQNYTITHILETHVHADHLTASAYLQTQLLKKGATQRPKICIGKRIKDVQSRFGARYHVDPSELSDAFDYTFSDDETFSIGSLKAQVLHLPGHTPDHIGYAIGPNVFTGDSIFNPDVGSARCDFPGGSANALFGSMSTLLALPAHYRLYTGHDYPPADRPHPNKADGAGDDDGDGGGGGREVPFTTVKEQKERNKHVRDGTVREDFVKWRSERDAGLAEPKVIHQALQFNIRGGRVPGPDPEGYRFLRVPLQVPQAVL